jgi:hypothetical protein
MQNPFVNIVNSHKINQPNVNSTIMTEVKSVEELNQSNENNDIKKA